MAKRADSAYASGGRTADWLKVKTAVPPLIKHPIAKTQGGAQAVFCETSPQAAAFILHAQGFEYSWIAIAATRIR